MDENKRQKMQMAADLAMDDLPPINQADLRKITDWFKRHHLKAGYKNLALALTAFAEAPEA